MTTQTLFTTENAINSKIVVLSREITESDLVIKIDQNIYSSDIYNQMSVQFTEEVIQLLTEQNEDLGAWVKHFKEKTETRSPVRMNGISTTDTAKRDEKIAIIRAESAAEFSEQAPTIKANLIALANKRLVEVTNMRNSEVSREAERIITEITVEKLDKEVTSTFSEEDKATIGVCNSEIEKMEMMVREMKAMIKARRDEKVMIARKGAANFLIENNYVTGSMKDLAQKAVDAPITSSESWFS